MEEKRKGAVNALLAEYKKAIGELQNVIANIENRSLIIVADPLTNNPGLYLNPIGTYARYKFRIFLLCLYSKFKGQR